MIEDHTRITFIPKGRKMDVEVWVAYDGTVHMRERNDEDRPGLEKKFAKDVTDDWMNFKGLMTLTLFDDEG